MLFPPILFSPGSRSYKSRQALPRAPRGRWSKRGIAPLSPKAKLRKALIWFLSTSIFHLPFWHASSSAANFPSFKCLQDGPALSRGSGPAIASELWQGLAFSAENLCVSEAQLVSRRHPQPQGGFKWLKQKCKNKERIIVQLWCFKNRFLKSTAETILTKEKKILAFPFREKNFFFNLKS